MSERRAALSSSWSWAVVVPVLAVIVLALAWGSDAPASPIVGLVTVALLAGAVLKLLVPITPKSSRIVWVSLVRLLLVLAVAVTLIEVALIVTLTDQVRRRKPGSRDTVFAAVIITCNGIVGLSILGRDPALGIGRVLQRRAGQGRARHLVGVTVATLATLASMVVPLTSPPRPHLGARVPLGAAARRVRGRLPSLRSLRPPCSWRCKPARHRDYFLSVTPEEAPPGHSGSMRPRRRRARRW